MNTSARSASTPAQNANTLLTRFQKELHEFLQEEKRSAWLLVDNGSRLGKDTRYIDTYVRSSYRLDAKRYEIGRTIRTFDLASIEIDPASRGKNNFEAIMKIIYEELAAYNTRALSETYKYKAVFVECVNNYPLYQHILREYKALNWGVNSLYIYI